MGSTKHHLLQVPRSALQALMLLGVSLLTLSATSDAQEANQLRPQAKVLNPSDIFFQAHLKLRNAEKLEKDGKFKKAWQDYKSALTYYSTLKKTHPLWKSNIVAYRIEHTQKVMSQLKPKLEKQLEAQAKARQGVLTNENVPNLSKVEFATSPKIVTITKKIELLEKDLKANQARHKKEQTLHEAHLLAAQGQLKVLKRSNQIAPEKAAQLRKQIKRTEKLLESTKLYQTEDRKKITQHIKQLKVDLKKISAAPLVEDFNRYKAELKKTNDEINIVSKALLQTQAEKNALIQRLKKKQKSLEVAQKEISTLKGELKEQSSDSVKVVKALYAKLEAAEKLQKSTSRELLQAKEQIADLSGKLDAQVQINEELRTKLQTVTEDRDRLNTLMLENPDTRLRKVVAQNLKLIEELKEKKLDVIRVTKDQQQNIDRMLKAERDLAVAKERLIQFQKEELATARKVKAMEQLLEQTRASSTGANTAFSEVERQESEELKRTATKFLNKLRVSQQKLALIKQEVSRRSQDPILLQMSQPDAGGNLVIQLTEREKELISQRKKKASRIDLKGQNGNMDPKLAQETMIRLQNEVNSMHSVSTRFIVRGKYNAAKDILEEANEMLPNNFTTLMNLGCVTMHMRELDEAEQNFKDGIVMKKNNPYAHYMLGMCYYKMNQDDLAEKSLKHSLSLDKIQPKAYYYLGAIAGSRQSLETADEYFKNALDIDPEMAEAYKARATIQFLQDHKEKAQDLYHKALEKGLKPDTQFAKKIGVPH